MPVQMLFTKFTSLTEKKSLVICNVMVLSIFPLKKCLTRSSKTQRLERNGENGEESEGRKRKVISVESSIFQPQLILFPSVFISFHLFPQPPFHAIQVGNASCQKNVENNHEIAKKKSETEKESESRESISPFRYACFQLYLR